MNRRWIALLTMLIVVLSAFPVYGESTEETRLIDEADLFDDDEEEELLDAMEELIDVYEIDVVIVTLENFEEYGYSMENAANNIYRDMGYGIGDKREGVMFAISMNDRDWWMKIAGDDANIAVNDYGSEYISEHMLEKLGNNEYYEAFSLYLADLADFFEAYDKGKPYGDDYQVRQTGKFIEELLVSLKRFWGYFARFFAGFSAIGNAIAWLLM